MIQIAQLEGEILTLIDDMMNGANIDRSDLQGKVSVIARKIYKLGASREGVPFDEALQMHKNEFATKFVKRLITVAYGKQRNRSSRACRSRSNLHRTDVQALWCYAHG